MEEWIVVVDDNLVNLKAAKRILNAGQIKARYFKSGEEVLKYLDGTRIPNLILLDIHMPEMDGFEVLKRLREQEPYEKVPVIFLTADDEEETKQKGIAAGATDYIKKPFNAESLVTKVREAIS